MIVPDRGDIIYLNFHPQTGREQAGRRPALVLSPKLFNKTTGYASVCPISNTKRKWGFHVQLPESLNTVGVVIVDQLKNLDYVARNVQIVERAPEETITDCLNKIRTFL